MFICINEHIYICIFLDHNPFEGSYLVLKAWLICPFCGFLRWQALKSRGPYRDPWSPRSLLQRNTLKSHASQGVYSGLGACDQLCLKKLET